MSKIIVLVDNDFIFHILETKKIPFQDIEKILVSAFQAKSIDPYMHELVYNNEFIDKNNSKLLFDHNVLSIISLNTILQNDSEKEEYYCFLVPELFKKIFGEELGFKEKEVLTLWKKQASLGEIHGLAACFIGGYGIFLSDDKGSKQISEILATEYKGAISVYNRQEFLGQFPSEIIPSKIRKAIAHIRS